MLKVKFLFPAASHSIKLWQYLSFRLKQYNELLKTAEKRYPIPPKPTSAQFCKSRNSDSRVRFLQFSMR